MAEQLIGSIQSEEELFIDNSEIEGKYLTFWTDNQLYGIPISNVVQIVQFQEITSIPESLPYMVGIINLRGSIIPVIDVRIRFGKANCEYKERTCIIVTSIRKLSVGFIVDGVNEVTNIDDNQIFEPPSVSRNGSSAFLTGIGKTPHCVTLLLNVSKLLSEEDFSVLSEHYENASL